MGFMKRPKAPEPTAQELAVEQRQSRMIDEEIAEGEKKTKGCSKRQARRCISVRKNR
jgi:hypothetical protein